jgi:SAM-dependent methyltransferase
MPTTDRLSSEAQFHDRQAADRRARFSDPNSLRFRDVDWLDHETWIRTGVERLGEVADRAVLDLGCGHGMAAVVLARRGARMTALDLSAGYLREARARAEANGVHVQFVQANAEQLPFPDASFACVWGNAILHHLDLTQTARELHRVLQPGGRAVFCEPWGGNPLLRWARRCLPYPGKQRTPDETPLGSLHLRQLRQVFPDVRVEGFQLLSMVSRFLGPGRVRQRLAGLDQKLLRWLPGLSYFCRYVVVTARS